MTAEQSQEVERAIARLKSFHDGGNLGVLDAIACGKQALWFQSENSCKQSDPF